MGKTSIEWCDWSINPIRATANGALGHYCEKVSPGCTHCYASRLQKRFKMPEFGSGQKRDAVKVFLDEHVLMQPLRRRKPTKYFWCDMSDLFGEWVPDEWIDKCLAVMALSHRHTHQVLTKRPERMADYFGQRHSDFPWGRLNDAANAVARALNRFRDRMLPVSRPLTNVWLGTSIENQETADARIPHLLRCPAVVRFLSCEPLLGPVSIQVPVQHEHPSGDKTLGWTTFDFPLTGERTHKQGGWVDPKLPRIHWIVVGGESGPGARPMHPDWARAIRDQCEAAGVPFFFKQWGEWLPADHSSGAHWSVEGRKLDEDKLAYRVGKKAAGRLLDGREWSEFPERTVPC